VPGVAILIELPGVGRVSIAASASPVLAAAALKALR
jgi:transposase